MRSRTGNSKPQADGDEPLIAVWGADGEARNAFLASLPLALEAELTEPGTWDLAGVNESAAKWLSDASDMLRKGLLPPATQQLDLLTWRITGKVPQPRWRRGSEVSFRIQVRDHAGLDMWSGSEPTEITVDLRRRADGFIFLFDPMIPGLDNLDSFTALLGEIRMSASGRRADGRMPHPLAICVTNFHHRRVFAAARAGLWINQMEAPPRQPCVLDRDAEDFFTQLCVEAGVEGLPGSIRTSFIPERIAFHVMSPVGFHIDAARTFGQQFQSNVAEDTGRLIGVARPINVFEPIARLAWVIRRHRA